MDQLLFSYGTLQLDSVQRAQFGRRLTGTDDVLTGYTVIEIHRALVADPEAPPIPGKVFRLTATKLAAADVYESENYRREAVVLASGTTAWVYVKAWSRPPANYLYLRGKSRSCASSP